MYPITILWVLITTLAGGNMSYITKEMAHNALERLKQYEGKQNELHQEHGLDFRGNIGRRNAMLSQAQEVFFGHEIELAGDTVVVDGSTNMPDIMIESRDIELECKLTSGSGGSWTLQTDYSTLTKKGELDFLYVLADSEFEKFAVLHFEGLTPDDFHTPNSGSREKGRMNKGNAMSKCTVLHGAVTCKNDDLINNYTARFYSVVKRGVEKIETTNSRISEITAPRKIRVLKAGKQRVLKNLTKKLLEISEKVSYWEHIPAQFSITLEGL